MWMHRSSERELSEYVGGLVERAARREAARRKRYGRCRALAERVAESLQAAYGPVDVYLVGSLLDSDRFDETSDLDFAVAGIPAERYVEALGVIEAVVGDEPFDLVLLDSLAPDQRALWLHEGVLLSGRQ